MMCCALTTTQGKSCFVSGWTLHLVFGGLFQDGGAILVSGEADMALLARAAPHDRGHLALAPIGRRKHGFPRIYNLCA